VSEATDPKLAADVANYYFTYLDHMLDRYASQSLRKREAFYSAQLERAEKEVESAEQALLKFQAENRVLAIDPNTKGTVDAAAGLRASIMGLEMQREVMRMRVTDQHPQMRELEKQIAELKRQYSKNLFGEAMDLPPEAPGVRGARKEFFVAAARMTPVQFAFLKLYRNLKVQEAFYTGAFQALQQMKYEDNSRTGRVQVLDPAIPPGSPARPRVSLMIAGAVVVALVLGIAMAFVYEYVRRLREAERRQRRPAREAAPRWADRAPADVVTAEPNGTAAPIVPSPRR
jgi:tyrosine-protein kinase Etk/Wzc